jgi:hypothetical protein
MASPQVGHRSSGLLSNEAHSSMFSFVSSSPIEQQSMPGPESSQHCLISEEPLISEDDILATIPARPSPVHTLGWGSREPSFYGTTACSSLHRDSIIDQDRITVEKICGEDFVVSQQCLRKFYRLTNQAPINPNSPYGTTFEYKYDESAYLVEKLHDRDDHEHLSPFRRFLFRLTPLFTFLSVGAYINYFFSRVKATRDEEKVDHKTYVLAWFFIIAEALISGVQHSISKRLRI